LPGKRRNIFIFCNTLFNKKTKAIRSEEMFLCRKISLATETLVLATETSEFESSKRRNIFIFYFVKIICLKEAASIMS